MFTLKPEQTCSCCGHLRCLHVQLLFALFFLFMKPEIRLTFIFEVAFSVSLCVTALSLPIVGFLPCPFRDDLVWLEFTPVGPHLV